MIIGITGGMGCGKSTATRLFAALGWRLIDSDAVVRDVILRDPEVVANVAATWGPDVLRPDGTIDRGALAGRVFADEKELALLESWVHPRLYAHWRAEFAAAPKTPWAVEVPLLFEQRLENWFDFIICVASSPDIQLARLSKRGIPHALAGQRISKQLPLARKLDSADLVLWNDGNEAFLHQQVLHLNQTLGQGSQPR